MSGVLVTGATQPLGRAVIARLLEADEGPILAVGLEEDGGFGPEVTYRRVDLSHSRAIKALVDGPVASMGLSCVVHLAFHRRGGGHRARKLHTDGTRELLHRCEAHPGVRRFIFRSSAEVYATRPDRPDMLREDHPLELSGRGGPWLQELVEADVSVAMRMGMAPMEVVILRCAEILSPHMGSQLYDYLQSRVCLRPLGFDPLVNVLSLDDAARAMALAVSARGSGVYNIPGKDILPLSRAARLWGRQSIGLPGPLLGPLYRWRGRLRGTDFRYEDNAWHFHFNGVLDGSRAREGLCYEPEVGVDWPVDEAL